MKTLIVAAAVLSLTGAVVAQQPSAATEAQANSAVQSERVVQVSSEAAVKTNAMTPSANSGLAVEAELTKSLDARKAKTGDLIIAKCTKEALGRGDFRIPKNAKLIGHVTDVQLRGRGKSDSALSIAFDRAVMKDGREIPFQGIIQAIAAAPTMEADSSMMTTDSTSVSTAVPRNNVVSGVNSAVSSTSSAVAGTAHDLRTQAGATGNAVLPTDANTSLNATTTGVVGLKGLQLDASTDANAQRSVVRSNSDNVRLESGTRLVLRLTAQ